MINPIFKLFTVVPFLLALGAQAAYPGELLRIESFPKEAKQGEACLIQVITPVTLQSIEGGFRGGSFPLFGRGAGGTFWGMLGIDMDTNPGAHEVRVGAVDGEGRAYSGRLLLRVEKVLFSTQTLTLPPSMVDLDPKTLERVNQEAKRLSTLLERFRQERLWRGGFVLPVQGEITSPFGVRRVINGKPRNPHTGIDLRAEEGTPVLASNSGEVVLSDHLFLPGKSVILDHGLGLFSVYFHLSETLVRSGEKVSKGGMIGRVGSTGRSTRPHLHWGIRMNGARVDPFSLVRLKDQLAE